MDLSAEYQRDVELRLQLLSAMMIDLVPLVIAEHASPSLHAARRLLRDVNTKLRGNLHE